MLVTTPQVSVLMPVYNGERFLAEALDDLLAQTFQDFELIVVDDGSTDGTHAILQSYAERDARLRLLRNEVNVGLTRSLNHGLAHCTAPLVARADADDRYHLERLARQTAYLAAHPDVGLLSCATQRMDEDGRWTYVARFPTEDGPIRMRELFVNCFSHPGVVFRTELVRAVGGYQAGYIAEDADLWARLRETTRAANLAEPLVFYRVLSTSLTRSTTLEQQRIGPVVRQRLLSQYLGRPLDMDETRALVKTFRASEDAPGSLDQLRIGRRGLREVLDAARQREDAPTVRYFRREVGVALLRHADLRRSAHPAVSWRLLWEAFRWWPRLLTERQGLGQVRRCLAAVRTRRSSR